MRDTEGTTAGMAAGMTAGMAAGMTAGSMEGCTYRGFVLVGCTHAGVMTLRPQVG